MSKEWLAMVLAEGNGARLGLLAKELAKPAVPFGGQYRLIDFALSNCRHSGVDTVGILTQYQPLLLHAYIGKGSAWDLDISGGGVHILPPYAREAGGHWYQGSADAVYQNSEFIEYYRPEYVVVAPGDHVGKLDYAAMLAYHKACGADATLGVSQVPRTDAAGQITVRESAEYGQVTGGGEKAHQLQNGQIFTGVYIFSWKVLKQFLELDAADDTSEHDLGKNIIPGLLAAGCRLYAYRFPGYWKDAGSIEGYWQASMDLLGDGPGLLLHDPDWPIYSSQLSLPPHYHGLAAKVCRSMIAGGAVILGEVENSVVFPGVYIGPGAKVKDSVILHQVRLESGISVHGAIVMPRTVLNVATVAANRTEGVIQVAGSQQAIAAGTQTRVSLAG